jgi:hypothetical protein
MATKKSSRKKYFRIGPPGNISQDLWTLLKVEINEDGRRVLTVKRVYDDAEMVLPPDYQIIPFELEEF